MQHNSVATETSRSTPFRVPDADSPRQRLPEEQIHEFVGLIVERVFICNARRRGDANTHSFRLERLDLLHGTDASICILRPGSLRIVCVCVLLFIQRCVLSHIHTSANVH